MKNRGVTFLILAVSLSTASPLFAAIELKLAHQLPPGSPWEKTLFEIARSWSTITNGEVVLTPQYREGSEEQFLQLMKGNAIQAAVFTSSVLSREVPAVMALSIPFVIRDNNEFDAVLKEVKPYLYQKIEERNFTPLALIKVGWVKIFSRSPVYTPDDLRKLKVATNPDDKKLSDAFRALRFTMVGANLNQIGPMLMSGKLDAVYQSPVAVEATKMYEYIPYMCTVNLAPFMGGIIMNKMGWNRIPAQYRDQLLEATRLSAQKIEISFDQQEADAISKMLKARKPITLCEVNAQQKQLWYNDILEALPGMLKRKTFDADMYQRIEAILNRIRGN